MKTHQDSPRPFPPNYRDLPRIPGTGHRHAWDVWGRDDNLGSINRIGDAQIRFAATRVRSGEIVPLTYALDEPRTGLFPSRRTYNHTVMASSTGRDDKIDELFLQYSSHWDGLRHIKTSSGRYWGNRTDATLDEGNDLGIDAWGERGPIARGVLADVARFQEAESAPIVQNEKFEISPDLLKEVLEAQGVGLRSGDILLVRTGWMEWFRLLCDAAQEKLAGTVGSGFRSPGLAADEATAEYLWDSGIAGVGVDNIACEALPVSREKGFLHRRLIPLLGIAIGEAWNLESIARKCYQAGQYDFLLVSAMLRIPRAAGSPANAFAIL